MLPLIQTITTKLESITERVFNEHADSEAPYPYVVFDFEEAAENEEQELYFLDVDVFDRPTDGDTTTLEEIAESIWKLLNKFHYNDSECQFSTYRNARGRIKNEKDTSLRCRRLTFEVRYFSKEGI